MIEIVIFVIIMKLDFFYFKNNKLKKCKNKYFNTTNNNY